MDVSSVMTQVIVLPDVDTRWLLITGIVIEQTTFFVFRRTAISKSTSLAVEAGVRVPPMVTSCCDLIKERNREPPEPKLQRSWDLFI